MKRNSSLHVLLLAAWGTYMTAYLCRVNLSTVLNKLSAGLGVSVIHDLMLMPNRYHVTVKRFDVPAIRDIAIAVKRDTPLSTITQLFVDHTRQWAKRQIFSPSPSGG